MIVLICAEVGTVFEICGKQAGQQLGESVVADDVCPKCGKNRFSDFRNATSDEILALGFQPLDYR
jgi:hypothetical protein